MALQALSSFGHVLRCHAEIVSGHYRQIESAIKSKTNKKTFDWKPCTDQEKLDLTFGTISRHLDRIREIADEVLTD
jgi:hypothetical protein